MSLKSTRKRVLLASVTVAYLLSISVLGFQTNIGDSQFGDEGASESVTYAEGIFMEMCKLVTWDMVKNMATNPVIYDASARPPIPTTGYKSLTRFLLQMIVIPYQIIILLTGIYIIYVSLIPRKRAYAKNYFTRLIVGMVLVALSPVIYQVILNIEHTLFMQIITSGTAVSGSSCSGLTPEACFQKVGRLLTFASCSLLVFPLTCTLGGVVILIAIFSYAVVWLRVLVVTSFGVIFPATVFFYMWNYTQGIGKKLMKYTFTWMFMPVVQALFCVIMVESMSNFSLTAQAGIMVVGGYIGIILSPLMLTGLMRVAGGATVLVSSKLQSPKLAVLGGIMMGHGPSAFSMGASMIAGGEATLGGDGRTLGGVDMSKDAPSFRRVGGIKSMFQAIRGKEGALSAVSAGIFGSGGGTVSDSRREAFEGGWKQLTGGRGTSVGTRLSGLAKVVGLPIGNAIHAKVLYPAGTMLTGMFHDASDLAPDFISKPLNKLGEALMGDRPIRSALKSVGASLGVVDENTGKIKPMKIAAAVGLGLALFTPMGNVAILGAMGATLGGSFAFGRGLSLKGVVEGYGAARGAGRGVIMSAWEGMRSTFQFRQLWAEMKLHGYTGFDGLLNRRDRLTRALSGAIGHFENKIRKIDSTARISYNGKNFVITTQNAATKVTLQQIQNQMNAPNAVQNSAQVGALLNKRNKLDDRIAQVSQELKGMQNLHSTVEGLAFGERHGVGTGQKAQDLFSDAELAANHVGFTFKDPADTGLTVAGVNQRAQELQNSTPGLTQQAAVVQALRERTENLGGLTQQQRTERFNDAMAAYNAGDDNNLKNATSFTQLNGSNAAQMCGSSNIGSERRVSHEEDRRRTVLTDAVTKHHQGLGVQAASAESAALQNHRRLGARELRSGRDAIQAELQRMGFVDQQGKRTARQPRTEREHMLVNALGGINRELDAGRLTVEAFNAQLNPLIRKHLQEVQQQVKKRKHTMAPQTQEALARRRAIREVVSNCFEGDITPAELRRRSKEAEAVLKDVGQGPTSADHDSRMKKATGRSATGRSAAEERDLLRLRPRAEYMQEHAQFSLAAMEQTELGMDEGARQARKDVAEYRQRIRDGLQPIFNLDEQRQADVTTLLNQTRTGRESGQELSVRSQRIDQALQNLGRSQYLDAQIQQGSMQGREGERDRLGRSGEQTLRQIFRQLKIDPMTDPSVVRRVAQEATRSQLLDQRVVNTHQMAYNAQGQLYHISDENRPLGQTLQWADLAPQQGMDERYTTTAQQLYDYARAADDRMQLTGKQEAFRSAEATNSSPDIAVHLKEADRVNPAGQLEECWVSTVDGLSNEAARSLSEEYNIRTRDQLAAAMQGPVVDAAGNITDPNTGQQVAVPGPIPGQTAKAGEHAIMDLNWNWKTLEQVTGTSESPWVLEAVNEGIRQSDWRVGGDEWTSVKGGIEEMNREKEEKWGKLEALAKKIG